MFKNIIIGLITLSTLVLAGCGSKTTSTTSTSGSVTNNTVGVASCDTYIKIIQCVADKGAAGSTDQTQLDQAIATWKTLPKEQLATTCDQMLQTLQANKEAFETIGCPVN